MKTKTEEKKWGGKRSGSGKKKGSKASHTLQAQEFKKLLIQEVLKEQRPIIKALIKRAKSGDMFAMREVLDRVIGKVTDKLELEAGDNLLGILKKELSKK